MKKLLILLACVALAATFVALRQHSSSSKSKAEKGTALTVKTETKFR